MTNYRRHPDPPYTPPTDAENDLGYWFDCTGCERRWSQRYMDRHTYRCLGCARAWRRDDKMSRRKGLGGVPFTRKPLPHPLVSKVLRREVNLNSDEARKLLQTNELFRAEVDAYVQKLIAENSTPKTPLHGVLPLLPRSKRGAKPVRVKLDDDPPETVSAAGRAVVDKAVNSAMNVIDGEIVDEKPAKRRR